MRKRYSLSATVEFIYDPEEVDPFFWTNPETGRRQWRMEGIYPTLTTTDDVLAHLAYNALTNGVTNASLLDGWGDLREGDLRMWVSVDSLDED